MRFDPARASHPTFFRWPTKRSVFIPIIYSAINNLGVDALVTQFIAQGPRPTRSGPPTVLCPGLRKGGIIQVMLGQQALDGSTDGGRRVTFLMQMTFDFCLTARPVTQQAQGA
ncbi:hypothetical protein NKDENANG_01323 [Candidatus Entotheonellaceae bacterium PAL068K]